MNSTEVQNLFKLALGCEEVGDYEGVFDYLVHSKLIDDPLHKRRCLKIVCRNYNRVGNYKMAMAHAFNIMSLLEKRKATVFKKDYAKAQFQLMIALMGLKDEKTCERIGKDAVNHLFKNKMNGTVMHARLYIACAQAGLLNKNYKSVFESYNKAREVLDSIKVSTKHYMTVLCGLSDYYILYAGKQYKESNQLMKTALSILDQEPVVYARTSVLQRLASSYVGLYQYELAHACLKEAYNIAYTLLGPNDTRTHYVGQQVLVLKQQIEHIEQTRPCSMCGTKGTFGTGDICGKQACMEKAWIIRGGTDSLVCRGCKKYFAIVDKNFLCKTCKP